MASDVKGRGGDGEPPPPMLQKHDFLHHYLTSPFYRHITALPEALSGVSGYDPMSEDPEAQALATLLPPNGYPRPRWSDQCHGGLQTMA